MKIENFTRIRLDNELEIWLEGNDITIKRIEYFGGSGIKLSFNELQDIVNAINGKKIEREVVKVFDDVAQPLTAEHIRKAVKKLKDGGQMYG